MTAQTILINTWLVVSFIRVFQKLSYQLCLAIEIEKQGLMFAIELEKAIHYEAIDAGISKVDFLASDKIRVGLKALTKLLIALIALELKTLWHIRSAS